MTEIPTHAGFTELLGAVFRVQINPEQAVEIELVEVSELKQSPRQEQFAITFRGPNEFFLGQGIRRLENEQAGSAEIFLVPIKQDASGFYYEAVFNNLREQG